MRVEHAADPAEFAARLAKVLLPVFGDIWSDPVLQVRSLPPRMIASAELPAACGDAVTFVHAFGREGRKLLLSLPREQLLRQVDRAFGGSGVISPTESQRLSASALLLSKRMANRLVSALHIENAGETFGDGEYVPNSEILSIFANVSDLHHFALEIGGGSASVSITVEKAVLAQLAPRKSASAGTRPRGRASLDDVPLSARARLVDMKMPLRKLAQLKVGEVIPVAISRDVPLQFEDVIVARGTVGDVDHQAALQITRISLGKDQK